MKVRKAVIPVAGLGTRLLPAAKVIPKEMLPVLDKPLIHHIVEEVAAAGLETVILVTRSGKEAIENYFETHFELEAVLEKKGKQGSLNAIRSVLPPGLTLESVRQFSALGLGHAIRTAVHAVENEPFAVILPDVLVRNRGTGTGSDLKKMIDAYEATGAAQIMVDEVPLEHVDRYGIVNCGDKRPVHGESVRIHSMVEKPSRDEAPSNLAVVGRYILPPEIMDILAHTAFGSGNEIQLTDGLNTLLEKQPVAAYHLEGATYDCGNWHGLIEASVRMGLQDDKFRNEFAALIRELAPTL